MANQKKIIAISHSPITNLDEVDFPIYQQKEYKGFGKLIIRGQSTDKNFLETINTILEIEVPLVSNSTCKQGDNILHWLGPEEWLLWTPLEKIKTVLSNLKQGLAPYHTALIDVSDYYLIFQLEGENVVDTLAHACPLDFRISKFKAESCAQTRFSKAPIMLYRINETKFYLQIRWSFSEYVWNYLSTVAKAKII